MRGQAGEGAERDPAKGQLIDGRCVEDRPGRWSGADLGEGVLGVGERWAGRWVEAGIGAGARDQVVEWGVVFSRSEAQWQVAQLL